MKIAISMPDKLFEQTDDLARRMRKSRSQVVAEALGEYVAQHDPDAITQALNALADEVDRNDSDFAKAAAQRVLERTDW